MPDLKAPPTHERDAAITRQRIIHAAYHEIHKRGFQGMRLDHVLKAADITKGGLYHHFDSKRALTFAVIDRVIHPYLQEVWLDPLRASTRPLQTLIGIIRSYSLTPPDELITLGCPVNNLVQEMSPLDEQFRNRLNRLYLSWQEGIASAIQRGMASGQIRKTVNPNEAALFTLAAMEGCIGVAKSAQNLETLVTCTSGLVGYLESLSTPPDSDCR